MRIRRSTRIISRFVGVCFTLFLFNCLLLKVPKLIEKEGPQINYAKTDNNQTTNHQNVTFRQNISSHEQFLSDLQSVDLSKCTIPKSTRPCEFKIKDAQRNFTTRLFGNYSDFTDDFPGLCDDGHYAPSNCSAKSKVAIIVPFRNRANNLKGLLFHLHGLLQKQQLEYQIFVVEQVQNQTFNKAKLLNIGYMVAQKHLDWDCYIFHDVDLYPLSDHIDYSCTDRPRLLLNGVEGWDGLGIGGGLNYKNYFGGVVQLTRHHMEAVNGFSNNYWGWGAEDDDMGIRLKKGGFEIDRSYGRGPFRNERPMNQGKEPGNLPGAWNLLILEEVNLHPIYKREGLSSLRARIVATKSMSEYFLIQTDLLENETKREREKLLSIGDLKKVLSPKDVKRVAKKHVFWRQFILSFSATMFIVVCLVLFHMFCFILCYQTVHRSTVYIVRSANFRLTIQ